MKVNKDLLLIKTHYFVRYAGTAFLSMALSVIVRQKGVSPQSIGFLWTVKSVVGLLVSTSAGTMADYCKAHRAVLLISLVLLTAGYVMTYCIPPLPFEEARYIIADSFSYLQSINNASADIPFIKESRKLEESVLSLNDTEPELHWSTDVLQFKIDPEHVENDPTLPQESETFDNDISPQKYVSITTLLEYPNFWLISIAVMIEQIGLYSVVMITDAICFQILGSKRHLYGQQRLWGTIGMGISSILAGALVDLYSKGQSRSDYFPAIILCVIFTLLDLIIVAKMNINSTKTSKIKMGEVGTAVLHPLSILFFVSVYIMGLSLSSIWVFKFMYQEDVASAWDPNFSNLKLLQGINIGIDTFGGEVPFFFISGMILERLSHKIVFAGCISATALRCCLYFTISNPWLFLPVDFLNGISYALFHAFMASYASHLAPPGGQATLQAISRAFFIAGQSTAGALGGLLYQSIGGARMYLSVGIFDAVYCIIFLILHFLISKYCTTFKSPGSSGYTTPKSITSDKLSSIQPNYESSTEKEGAETKTSLIENV